jgi:integrase
MAQNASPHQPVCYRLSEMAVFQRTYKDKATGAQRRCDVFSYDFIFAGVRYRGSTNMTSKTRARVFEDDLKKRLERALAGMPVEEPAKRVRTVSAALDNYEAHFGVDHAKRSTDIVKERGVHLRRLLGTEIAAALTESRMQKYREQRIREGAGPRTIDMEVAVLSRAFDAKWAAWWPKLKPLDKGSEVGQAISPGDEPLILDAAAKEQSPYLYTYLMVAFRTGFRAGETRQLKWERFIIGPSHQESYVRTGQSKTKAGENRAVPMDQRLWAAMVQYRAWYETEIGDPQPGWHVFPWGTRKREDPTRPITNIKKAWQRLKAKLKVNYRLHDARHTLATKMAIAGVPEAKRRYLMGHVDENVIRRYTHLQAEDCRADLERALGVHESALDQKWGQTPTPE